MKLSRMQPRYCNCVARNLLQLQGNDVPMPNGEERDVTLKAAVTLKQKKQFFNEKRVVTLCVFTSILL